VDHRVQRRVVALDDVNRRFDELGGRNFLSPYKVGEPDRVGLCVFGLGHGFL
jgi:hypothetical protein